MSARRALRGGDEAADVPGVVPSAGRGDAPVLPTGAREDSARAWGDDERDDDERLLRERPPHW